LLYRGCPGRFPTRPPRNRPVLLRLQRLPGHPAADRAGADGEAGGCAGRQRYLGRRPGLRGNAGYPHASGQRLLAGTPLMTARLRHLDQSGRARMVDVGGKAVTERSATAKCLIRISAELTQVLKTGTLEKGDAFTVAKTAGILAAKQTGTLIPMCHPLPLN